MKIQKHGNLVDTENGGNGYHGRCEHCGLAFVTDLGYCSWSDTVCIEREVESESDIPSDIKSYAQWRGLIWDRKNKVYVKSYSSDEYTIDEIRIEIDKIIPIDNQPLV